MTMKKPMPPWLRAASYVPLAVVAYDAIAGTDHVTTLVHFLFAVAFIPGAIAAAALHSAWARGREQRRRVERFGGGE